MLLDQPPSASLLGTVCLRGLRFPLTRTRPSACARVGEEQARLRHVMPLDECEVMRVVVGWLNQVIDRSARVQAPQQRSVLSEPFYSLRGSHPKRTLSQNQRTPYLAHVSRSAHQQDGLFASGAPSAPARSTKQNSAHLALSQKPRQQGAKPALLAGGKAHHVSSVFIFGRSSRSP